MYFSIFVLFNIIAKDSFSQEPSNKASNVENDQNHESNIGVKSDVVSQTAAMHKNE